MAGHLFILFAIILSSNTLLTRFFLAVSIENLGLSWLAQVFNRQLKQLRKKDFICMKFGHLNIVS